MSQIENKATGCACGTSFKASATPAAQERQEKACSCCGGTCECASCDCGDSCRCGG